MEYLRLYDKYSILVRQYALTLDEYIIIGQSSKKLLKKLGGLFDLQPPLNSAEIFIHLQIQTNQ